MADARWPEGGGWVQLPPALLQEVREKAADCWTNELAGDEPVAELVERALGEWCEDAEKMVRDLLQRTWDDLAATVPDVVEEPEQPTVMPGSSAFSGAYVPAARSGPREPQC